MPLVRHRIKTDNARKRLHKKGMRRFARLFTAKSDYALNIMQQWDKNKYIETKIHRLKSSTVESTWCASKNSKTSCSPAQHVYCQ